MAETPIRNNQAILQRLYCHFDYLLDLPCQLEGQDLDNARYLGTLETGKFLGFVLGYEVEEGKIEPDHFPMLSNQENQQINYYRLLKPVVPWPQPTVGVAMPSNGPGKITGTHTVPAVLQPCGSAQCWWGGEVAVLWEALLSDRVRQYPEFESLLNQLWQCCEEFLASQGVHRIYTYDRDPGFQLDWYRAFLEGRGYKAVADRKITVVKEVRKSPPS